MIATLLSCSKQEIKPVNVEKTLTENVIKSETIKIYLITFEFENIVNFQSYATNEAEIKLICESMLSEYDNYRFDYIDYKLGYVSYNVYSGGEWIGIVLKLYTFNQLNSDY